MTTRIPLNVRLNFALTDISWLGVGFCSYTCFCVVGFFFLRGGVLFSRAPTLVSTFPSCVSRREGEISYPWLQPAKEGCDPRLWLWPPGTEGLSSQPPIVFLSASLSSFVFLLYQQRTSIWAKPFAHKYNWYQLPSFPLRFLTLIFCLISYSDELRTKLRWFWWIKLWSLFLGGWIK